MVGSYPEHRQCVICVVQCSERPLIGCCSHLAMGWTSEESCSDYGKRYQISLFPDSSGPIKVLNQSMVSGTVCRGQILKLTSQPKPIAGVKSEWSYTSTHTFYGLLRGNFAFTINEVNTRLYVKMKLTFRNLASYIQDGRKITLQMPHFIFIQQISVLNILNLLYKLHFFLFKMPFIT